jgi:hypothetical protein
MKPTGNAVSGRFTRRGVPSVAPRLLYRIFKKKNASFVQNPLHMPRSKLNHLPKTPRAPSSLHLPKA